MQPHGWQPTRLPHPWESPGKNTAHSSRYKSHLSYIHPFQSILFHWLLKCWCWLLPSPVLSLPIFLDSWTSHSKFLCNNALYSIRSCYHHQSHPQLGVVFALAPSLHSFWNYFSTFSSSILGTYWPGEFSFQCPPFAFSYCKWGSQGRNAEVVCHSLLQGTTFCQTSPPWPVCPEWPFITSLS